VTRAVNMLGFGVSEPEEHGLLSAEMPDPYHRASTQFSGIPTSDILGVVFDVVCPRQRSDAPDRAIDRYRSETPGRAVPGPGWIAASPSASG